MNKKKLKIGVIGGGAGSYANVAYLLNKGYSVYWWMRNKDKIKYIKHDGKISVSGELNNSFQITYIGNDIEKIIKNSDIIFIVLPAHIHEEIIKMIKPFLTSDKLIILHPGRTGGAIITYEILKYSHPNIVIAETQSLIFTARLVNFKKVHILKIKKFGQIAFLNKKFLPEEYKLFFNINFPQIEITDSIMITSLNNMGAILHPAPVIFNIGRIEDNNIQFKYYYEGITKTISQFIWEMDKERILIANKLNIKILSLIEWHHKVYGIKGKNLKETLMLNKEYASLLGPKTLNHRYIYEDILTGLVPMLEIGKELNLNLPKIEIIINLAEMLLNFNFIQKGRNRKKLNLLNYIGKNL